jgi:hypothetical protein
MYLSSRCQQPSDGWRLGVNLDKDYVAEQHVIAKSAFVDALPSLDVTATLDVTVSVGVV